MIVRAVASTLNGLSSRPPPGSNPKQKKSVKCNNAANMPLLATIMKHTDTQLKSAELASVLGVSPVQVRQVNKDKKSKKNSILDVKQVNKRKGKLSTHSEVQNIIVAFFLFRDQCVFRCVWCHTQVAHSQNRAIAAFLCQIPQAASRQSGRESRSARGSTQEAFHLIPSWMLGSMLGCPTGGI